MNPEKLTELLQGVAGGKVSVEEALRRLSSLPFEDLGFAKLDHHRSIRCGMPEVVFCEGKTPDEIEEIARGLLAEGALLATRADDAAAEAIRRVEPSAEYYPRARVVTVGRDRIERVGKVVVLSAGTSDADVAQEAVLAAEMAGSNVEWIADVGVAGLHRLLAHRETIVSANAVVVVAGMEGALPSVVGGLVDTPVIGVPTSVGYGASMGGIAALLAMLSTCAAGVTVVNIDNGFGAGVAASLINRRVVAASG